VEEMSKKQCRKFDSTPGAVQNSVLKH